MSRQVARRVLWKSNLIGLETSTSLEKWFHFFRFAARLTPQEVSARLGDEEFAEAAEVLEHINRTPRERTMYDARLKMERDTAACVLQARIEGREEGLEEGREEGREEGQSIGAIRVLQDILGVAQTSVDELKKKTLEELRDLEHALRGQLQNRG